MCIEPIAGMIGQGVYDDSGTILHLPYERAVVIWIESVQLSIDFEFSIFVEGA